MHLSSFLLRFVKNPEFHDLTGMDKGHWPTCRLWNGWLPLLSGETALRGYSLSEFAMAVLFWTWSLVPLLLVLGFMPISLARVGHLVGGGTLMTSVLLVTLLSLVEVPVLYLVLSRLCKGLALSPWRLKT